MKFPAVEYEINHGRCVKGEQLADDKASADRDAERPAQFSSDPVAQGKRKRTQQGGEGGHQDRPKTQKTSLGNGISGALSFMPLSLKCEVDHHDRVLLHDADEQQDPDAGDHIEFASKEDQCKYGSYASRRQGREDGERMDVALVQDAKSEVDGGEGANEQDDLVGLGTLQLGEVAGGGATYRSRQADFLLQQGKLLFGLP